MIALLVLAVAAPVPLTLAEALDLARTHQPQLQAARQTRLASEATADAARAPLLPSLAGTAGYQRLTANYVARPGSLPVALAQQAAGGSGRSYDFYTVGLGLTQLVYDFGQTTGAWRSAKASAAAQRLSEQAVRLQVELAVRLAYFQALAQRALVDVARETLANHERHLAQVESFVRLGRRPEIDVAQVRTERANAVLTLITAENNYATALTDLQHAMGSSSPSEYELVDGELASAPGEDAAAGELLEEAMRQRPEIAALEQQVEAQAAARDAVRGAYYPALSLSAGLSEAGPRLDALAWNWNAGAVLSWPFFSGGLTWAQARAADASLAGLRAQVAELKQSVVRDVEQTRLALVAARAMQDAVAQAVLYAREQLRLAEARYETGIGSAIELDDAQLALTDATAKQVQADFQLSAARARLLGALGRH